MVQKIYFSILILKKKNTPYLKIGHHKVGIKNTDLITHQVHDISSYTISTYIFSTEWLNSHSPMYTYLGDSLNRLKDCVNHYYLIIGMFYEIANGIIHDCLDDRYFESR